MMKTSTRIALFLLLIPGLVLAQGFRDLDTAMSGIAQGFERGDSSPIVSGMTDGDQVMLQFPGLTGESGFFGKDQASYVLDELFEKVQPTAFHQVSARKISSAGQYQITAAWKIQPGGKAQERDLYITLQKKGDRWTVASIRSGSR